MKRSRSTAAVSAGDKPVFHCPGRGCTRTFATFSGRWKHEKNCKFPKPLCTSNADNTKKYEKIGDFWHCMLCPSKFTAPSNWHKHYKIYHVEGKLFAKDKEKIPHTCIGCLKSFDKLVALTSMTILMQEKIISVEFVVRSTQEMTTSKSIK